MKNLATLLLIYLSISISNAQTTCNGLTFIQLKNILNSNAQTNEDFFIANGFDKRKSDNGSSVIFFVKCNKNIGNGYSRPSHIISKREMLYQPDDWKISSSWYPMVSYETYDREIYLTIKNQTKSFKVQKDNGRKASSEGGLTDGKIWIAFSVSDDIPNKYYISLTNYYK